MDKDSLKKIISKGGMYFPIIALFFILDKTNNSLDLFVLFFAFSYVVLYDTLIIYLVSKIDPKIKKLLEEKRKDLALNEVIKGIVKITPSISGKIFWLVLAMIKIVFLSYVIVGLLELWEYHISKFLFFIGIITILYQLAKWINNFLGQVKIILNKNPSRKELSDYLGRIQKIK